MLVLSRKCGEEVIIAGTIKVVVSRISGNRVSIGVEAPESMRIVRGELVRWKDQPERSTSVADLARL